MFRALRSAAVIASLALLAATPTLLAEDRPPVSQPQVELADIVYVFPTNAATIFRWGPSRWEDEFKVDPIQQGWRTTDPRLVRTQNGMLTLEAWAGDGTVTATWPGYARRFGRWEARVRGNQYETQYTPYEYFWELIPTGPYACGAKSLVLANFKVDDPAARLLVRRPNGIEFTASRTLDLSNHYFHTYAIEITRNRITWFVDRDPVMTERRSEILSFPNYVVRFRMQAQPGKRMNHSRMQMDWVRTYSLERPNVKSIEAPQGEMGTYNGCGG